MTEVRPATAADFRAVYGREPERSFQGYALRVDGKPVAVCGLYRAEGKTVAFSQVAQPAPKRGLVRLANTLLDLMRQRGTQVYALRDESVPTSGTLLSHLGFKRVGSAPEGGVYQWLT